jgi:hypothetical protein
LRTTPTLTFIPAVPAKRIVPRFVERVSAATLVPWRPSGGEMLLRAPINGKIESVTGGIRAREAALYVCILVSLIAFSI